MAPSLGSAFKPEFSTQQSCLPCSLRRLERNLWGQCRGTAQPLALIEPRLVHKHHRPGNSPLWPGLVGKWWLVRAGSCLRLCTFYTGAAESGDLPDAPTPRVESQSTTGLWVSHRYAHRPSNRTHCHPRPTARHRLATLPHLVRVQCQLQAGQRGNTEELWCLLPPYMVYRKKPNSIVPRKAAPVACARLRELKSSTRMVLYTVGVMRISPCTQPRPAPWQLPPPYSLLSLASAIAASDHFSPALLNSIISAAAARSSGHAQGNPCSGEIHCCYRRGLHFRRSGSRRRDER